MSLDNSPSTSYEDDDIQIFIENRVVICHFKVEHVTYEIAKKVSDLRMQLSEGKLHVAISDVRVVTRMDSNVRDFFASPEACENVVAGAIVVKSNFQKLAGNFFIYISKPMLPAKIFTDIPDALQWLEKYIDPKNPHNNPDRRSNQSLTIFTY